MMTSVREIGEEGLLRQLSRLLESHTRDLPLGIGDDVAVTPREAVNGRLVWTIDTMVEGTHFRFWKGLPDLEWLGNRLAVANLSDLASKGAAPLFALVSLGIPASADSGEIEQFYHGLDRALISAGARLIGGDTVLAPQWNLSLVLTGTLEDDQAIPARHKARPGQNLFLTGLPGATGAAIRLLEEGHHLVDGEHLHPLVSDVLYSPLNTLHTGRAITFLDPDAAMLDVSDGVARDAGRLASASGTRIVLEQDTFPYCERLTAVSRKFHWNPLDLFLHGGEDFELLFASSLSEEELLDGLDAHESNCRVTRIGRVEEGAGVVLETPEGDQKEMPRSGFEHFA